MRDASRTVATALKGQGAAAVGLVAAIAVTWLSPLAAAAHQSLAAHMLQHVLAMNAAALPAAWLWRGARLPTACGPLTAAGLQVAALMIWHLPGIFAAAAHDALAVATMQACLFAAGLVFWVSILDATAASPWRAIVGLLLSAKGACLLGAALVFSRQSLFAGPHGPVAIEDQHLAGLVMVAACAVIYSTAALALFVHWLMHTREQHGAPG